MPPLQPHAQKPKSRSKSVNQRPSTSHGTSQPKSDPTPDHQKVLYETQYYPYRHFPELRQSVRAASANESSRRSRPLLPVVPVMEHKTHSFARAQSPTLNAARPKSSSATAIYTERTHLKHNEDKIFEIQKKMSRLRRGSCLDEIFGLQHVRRAILQESNKIRKDLLDMNDPRHQGVV